MWELDGPQGALLGPGVTRRLGDEAAENRYKCSQEAILPPGDRSQVWGPFP